VTLHTVPNSYKEVNASINHGDPMIDMASSNAVTKNLAAFALSLSPREDENRGFLGRLFRRA
jgi:pilus assembly protein CpaE